SGMALLLGLSAHWWRTHRIGYPDPPEVARLRAEEVSDAEAIAAAWEANVGADGAAAPGTRLAEYRRTAHAHQWTIQMRPGSGGLADLKGRLRSIATGIDVAEGRITLDSHPSGSPRRAVLRVTVDSPVAGG